MQATPALSPCNPSSADMRSAGWHVSIVFGSFAILANTLKVQTPDTRKSERLPS
jgi:hypothetical protein